MKIALESPRHFRYLVTILELPDQCLVRLQINPLFQRGFPLSATPKQRPVLRTPHDFPNVDACMTAEVMINHTSV